MPDSPNKPMWQPNPDRARQTAMARFLAQVAARHGIDKNYHALYRWSIESRDVFWATVWDFVDIRASQKWDDILENGDAMPGARWFVGSRLNFAENLLKRRDDHAALIGVGETGIYQTLTYRQLYAEVARVAAWLKSRNIKAGDRIAAYMANTPQTVIAMLACASIGAVWSSCSPDFGVKGVLERFAQIKPRILFAVDGYRYNGKAIDTIDAVADIADGLPSVADVVIAPFLNPSLKLPPKLSSKLLRGELVLFDELHAAHDDIEGDMEIEFAQLPFDHPLYILYSSGTTGAPKCIVHGAGGTLIQHRKEHVLHTDLTAADTFFYFTTCGWMMWNWLVSGLASGCALVLYDGSPFFPRSDSLWRLADEIGISIFGTGARYLAASAKANVRPRNDYKLAELRAILSTGSPLAAEHFDYVYADIKADLMLSSISGGTDIVSCFVLGNPLLAVHRGEIQCRGLGMAVDIYGDDKKSAPKSLPKSLHGERGELVCTKPFPSMPLGFWNEPDNRRYHDAYFARFENVWAQGDYAELTDRDGIIIYGRSDAVLNPGGVRIGTAEIYAQVEKIDAVLESLCIGQNWHDDVRIVLFVMLRAGETLTEQLKTQIRDTIRSHATHRHVPAKIIAVPDIPRTRSGKITELAVRNIIHGDPVKNTEALANPAALEYFRGVGELEEE